MPSEAPSPQNPEPLDIESQSGSSGGTTTKAKATEKAQDKEPVLENAETPANGHVLADRSAFLNMIGDLDEAEVPIVLHDGKVLTILVRELTGDERAELITLQAEALHKRGELEIRKYEQKLLYAGIADPESPRTARQPLLRAGDVDSLMKLGASKTQVLVTKIEELSGMGAGALVRAEGNSETTPSDDSTSG